MDAQVQLEHYPCVTIIIPMRNEERYIAECLDSILANDYPKERLEVLVIDGMSTDNSREIVQNYVERFPFIRMFDNPKINQASALNLGIREARGEIILRMDAHTFYAPDYIRRCVELLQTTGAANVGGVLCAIGTSYVSNTIAIGVTNPFGIGDAHYRYAEKELLVDTVCFGAWHKSTLEGIGGFREEYVLNEDYELNYRIRKMGGKILLSPKIRSWYYVRPSLGALARQYFRYGFYKVKTLKDHPESIRWRQLAPPALIVGFLISLIIFPFNSIFGSIIPVLYIVVTLLASIWSSFRKGWRYLPLLPVVFATIHLSWGLGFLCGLFKWGWPKITPICLIKAFMHLDKVL